MLSLPRYLWLALCRLKKKFVKWQPAQPDNENSQFKFGRPIDLSSNVDRSIHLNFYSHLTPSDQVNFSTGAPSWRHLFLSLADSSMFREWGEYTVSLEILGFSKKNYFHFPWIFFFGGCLYLVSGTKANLIVSCGSLW